MGSSEETVGVPTGPLSSPPPTRCRARGSLLCSGGGKPGQDIETETMVNLLCYTEYYVVTTFCVKFVVIPFFSVFFC